MVEEISQHANALAMRLRLKHEGHQAIARDVLLKGMARGGEKY
jgi:hypothetical protein